MMEPNTNRGNRTFYNAFHSAKIHNHDIYNQILRNIYIYTYIKCYISYSYTISPKLFLVHTSYKHTLKGCAFSFFGRTLRNAWCSYGPYERKHVCQSCQRFQWKDSRLRRWRVEAQGATLGDLFLRSFFSENFHRTFFGKPEKKNMVYRLPEV